MRKLGEVVTSSLECKRRRWKVVEHVREKFTCRDCESITGLPAPSHPILDQKIDGVVNALRKT